MSRSESLDRARELVAEGREDETVRYTMTLAAGTAVAIDDATPAGMTIQDATLLLLAHALVERE